MVSTLVPNWRCPPDRVGAIFAEFCCGGLARRAFYIVPPLSFKLWRLLCNWKKKLGGKPESDVPLEGGGDVAGRDMVIADDGAYRQAHSVDRGSLISPLFCRKDNNCKPSFSALETPYGLNPWKFKILSRAT